MGKFCTRCWRLLDDQKPAFPLPSLPPRHPPLNRIDIPSPFLLLFAKSLFLSTRRYLTILVTTLPSTLDLSAPSNVDGGVEGGAVLCELTRWSGSGSSSFLLPYFVYQLFSTSSMSLAGTTSPGGGFGLWMAGLRLSRWARARREGRRKEASGRPSFFFSSPTLRSFCSGLSPDGLMGVWIFIDSR